MSTASPSAAAFSAAISGPSSPAGSLPLASMPLTIAFTRSSAVRISVIPVGVTSSVPSR